MTKYNTGDKVNGYTFVKEYPHFNLWKLFLLHKIAG